MKLGSDLYLIVAVCGKLLTVWWPAFAGWLACCALISRAESQKGKSLGCHPGSERNTQDVP